MFFPELRETSISPFDSLLFIDIFIVLDFILDQLIGSPACQAAPLALVICEDIISFLIFCKI